MSRPEHPLFSLDPTIQFASVLADQLAQAAATDPTLTLTDPQVQQIMNSVTGLYAQIVERRDPTQPGNQKRVRQAAGFASLAYQGSLRRHRQHAPTPAAPTPPPAPPVRERETRALNQLLGNVQDSALGRAYRVTGTVHTPAIRPGQPHLTCCTMTVQLQPDHALELTVALHADDTAWTVQRDQMDAPDRTVTVQHEDELLTLTYDLLRHVAQQTTPPAPGGE